MTWRDALGDALKSNEHASATSYASSHPLMSLTDLAKKLPHSGIASAQLAILLERKLVEEADAAGTMEQCARSLLARDLHDELSEGWPREWKQCEDDMENGLFRRAGVFHTLTMALPECYTSAIGRIRQAMCTADIPAGWLPEGPEDPILLEVFGNQWASP